MKQEKSRIIKQASPGIDIIRAGYSGQGVVIKIHTNVGAGGWKILERGFDNYSQAVDRLRILLHTGQFIEG